MGRRNIFLTVWSLALFVVHTPVVWAQGSQAVAGPASVQEALSTFLKDFDNLDWPAFRDCFSQDATIFHPAAPNVRRTDGAEQFETAWLNVFARLRKTSGRTSPPYMDLKPLDLRLEMLSGDVALATFHLIDGKVLNRRTIVFKREASGWKIVHIHASNLATP